MGDIIDRYILVIYFMYKIIIVSNTNRLDHKIKQNKTFYFTYIAI